MTLSKDDIGLVLSLIEIAWKKQAVASEESAIALIMLKRRLNESLNKAEAPKESEAQTVAPAA